MSGVHESRIATRASYDRVAAEYANRFTDELARKPLERQLLDRIAALSDGTIADIGCGPGQVAAYLHERGSIALGLDLSTAMVAEASRRHPTILFIAADLRALPRRDRALAGIIAFYCLIHIPREELVTTLREFRRVLRPGGWLLIGFHQGRETVQLDEWWNQPVTLDFHFFEPAEMANYLDQVGFNVEEVVERDPYPEIEAQTRRASILARNGPLTERAIPDATIAGNGHSA